MAYYTALINAWNSATQPPPGVNGTPLTGGMTTAQKIAVVNGWTVTGTVPTTIYFTGVQLLNCINYTEFKGLNAQQQSNILALCNNTGPLLGGSAETAFVPVGIIIDYFKTNASITSGTYNSGTGIVTLTMGATVTFGPGGNITISGLTGTGAFAQLNGVFPVVSASGTTVTYNAGAGLGASTITNGSLVPPTVTALTALAQATVQPWWQASVANGGSGLTSPVSPGDTTAAGLS
jgi:hypothetical protein